MSVVPYLEGPRIIRHDQSIGLATLFLPLAKGVPRPKLDVVYAPARGGRVLRFSGKDALGIPEQTLLLVILELAQAVDARASDGGELSEASVDPTEQELWTALYRNGRGEKERTIHFVTTWHEIAVRGGISTSGPMRLVLMQQLRRLCECVVWERDDENKAEWQSFLIAMVYGDDRRLHIALNGRLASALFEARYMPVSLSERLQLPTDTAQALHAFLSVWLRHGESQKVGLDTLAQRLWPRSTKAADPPPRPGTVRRRRSDVRSGLREIAGLPGWSVKELDGPVAVVRRLRPRVGPAVASATRSVRDTTSHIANAGSSYRRRPEATVLRPDAGFGTADVSALLLS